MSDMVKIAVGTKYDYVNLLDFLAQLHLGTSLVDVCEKYYDSFDPTNKISGKEYAAHNIAGELISYVDEFYEGDFNSEVFSYIASLVDSMYSTNGTIRTLFSSVLNRMREDGISTEQIKEAQKLLRVTIVL